MKDRLFYSFSYEGQFTDHFIDVVLPQTRSGENFPLIVSAGGTEWLYFTRNMATAPALDFDLFVSVRTRSP